MSPVDAGDRRIYRDKDSIFRDERGLLSMPHLTAFIASVSGVVFGVAGLVAFFLRHADAMMLIQISLGLVASGAGLEGWQTHVEGRNQRNQ
jgi:hypothetical protein